MKLSPYVFDFGRVVKLVSRPNFSWREFSRRQPPDDEVFPCSGLLELPQVIPPDLCDQVIRDHEDFEVLREQKRCAVRDANGRNYRLTNFHLESDTLLRIGLADAFHSFATKFFKGDSSVYTSLFYKHGCFA